MLFPKLSQGSPSFQTAHIPTAWSEKAEQTTIVQLCSNDSVVACIARLHPLPFAFRMYTDNSLNFLRIEPVLLVL